MLIGGLQQHKIFSFLQCAQDNNCKNAGSTVPEITIFLLNCVLDNNKKEKWGFWIKSGDPVHANVRKITTPQNKIKKEKMCRG